MGIFGGKFARLVNWGKHLHGSLVIWGGKRMHFRSLEVSTEGSLGKMLTRKVMWEKVDKFVSRLMYIIY
jgi:hypothetical protein